ncbi:hypothetical protein ACM16X_02515 [Haloarcula japonica]|uniref:hypothetical protein n=1 Tax=Haloarcula japonica TaxID=29282 RepID=UPI0039F6AEA9
MPDNLQDFKNQPMKETTLFRAYSERKPNGKIQLYLQTHEQVEEFFKTEETDQSNEWEDGDGYHQFYKRQYEKHGDSELADYFSDKHDKFGVSYINNGKINLALLRTVGISNGIEFEIPASYSEETLTEAVDTLRQVTEEIYKKFIRPVKIKSKSELEN